MNLPALHFFDTHLHAQSMLAKDPILLEKTRVALSDHSLTQGIDVGLNPGDLQERLPLLRDLGIAWYALGLYPSHAAEANWRENVAELAAQILSLQRDSAINTSNGDLAIPRLVAIGEIGIDLFHHYAEVGEQQALLEAQIEIANSFGLPVIIHNRNADQALIESMRNCPPIHGGILHCFSSDWETAVQLLDYGFRISFAGNLTYKSASDLRQIAARLPLNRLLCETDSPYLGPEPFRGKPNWPGQVRLVYECLALTRQIPLADLTMHIEANLQSLLPITRNPVAGEWPW